MTELIKSQKNKDQIVYENFIYEIKRQRRNFIEWRCVHKSCNSIGKSAINYTTNLASFFVVREHNHASDSNRIINKKFDNSIKTRLLLSNESNRAIVHNVLRGAREEVINAVGDFNLIFRNLRNQRVKIINPPPYRYPTLKLSDQLSKTHTNDQFYRYGPDNFGSYPVYDDIVIFYSDSLANKLSQNNIWSVDGTFKCVPSPYLQLFTISFLVDHHVFPAVFVLLKNK